MFFYLAKMFPDEWQNMLERIGANSEKDLNREHVEGEVDMKMEARRPPPAAHATGTRAVGLCCAPPCVLVWYGRRRARAYGPQKAVEGRVPILEHTRGVWG